MNKVLTERPRHGGAYIPTKKTAKKYRPIDLDDENDIPDEVNHAPSGRHRVYGCASKKLADLISPLRRYLESKVGTPWDDVYSECCTTLDRRSMSGNHVFEHLRDMVTLTTIMVDGKVMEVSSGSGTPMEIYYDSLYVHPETGLLCKNPGSRPKWTPKPDPNIMDGPTDLTRYTKIEGIWYLSEYKRTFPEKHRQTRRTYWHQQAPADFSWFTVGCKREWDETVEIHGRNYVFHRTSILAAMIRIGKRQLSKSELKALGLSNDKSTHQMSRRQLKRLFKER